MRTILGAAFLCVAGGASAHAQTTPMGDWSRGDGNARVHVGPCGDALCAVNTWIAADIADEHVGDRLIMRVAKDSEGYYLGRANDPQRKLDFDITIEVAEKTMKTRGCLMWVLCKEMGWTRVPQDKK